MYAKLYFDGVSNGALSYEDMMDDIVAVLTGETDFNNLKVATAGESGEIVSTVAPGWTLESKDSTSESGYVHYILSSVPTGATTKRQYLQMALRLSNGDVAWLASSAVSPTNPTWRLYNTLMDGEMGRPSLYSYNEEEISNSTGYYIYLSAFSYGVMLMQGRGSQDTLSAWERTRNLDIATDTADSDYCAMYVFLGTRAVYYNNSSTSISSHIVVPDPFSEGYRIAYGTGDQSIVTDMNGVTAMFAGEGWLTGRDTPGYASRTNDNGDEELIFTKPRAVSGKVELGEMHPDLPWFTIDDNGAPSNVPGQEVVVERAGEPTRTYVVFSSEWSVSTTTPLYIEKK